MPKFIVTVTAEVDFEIYADSESKAKIKALSEVDTQDFDTVRTCVEEIEDNEWTTARST